VSNSWEQAKKEDIDAAKAVWSPPQAGGALLTSPQIGIRLGIAFVFLVAILIGIGILGLSRMEQSNAALEDLTGRQWSKLQLAQDALTYSNQNSRITVELFLLKRQRAIDRLLADRAQNTQKISNLVAKIEGQCDSPEERRLLAAVQDARALYIASYLRALRLLVDERNRDESRSIMVRETTPALNKYHDAWNKFMQFQIEQIDKAGKESRARYGYSRSIAVSMIVLAVIVAVVIAFFVTINMVKEITTRTLVEREVRELNTDLEQRVEHRTQELIQSNQHLTGEIAERKSAEEKYRAIFQDAVVGIFQTTPEGRTLSANQAMAQMHGYDSPGEMTGKVSDVVRQILASPSQLQESARALEEKDAATDVEVEVHGKNGVNRWCLANVRAVRGTDGKILRYEGTVQDITERRNAEEQVRYLAYYDALTSLPNRTLLQDRLAKALATARRRQEKVALLLLNLDRFKTINDSLGRSVGDLLLKQTAERLKKWSREQDTLARLDGDEFVIVVNAVKDVADAAVAADRLTKVLSTEFKVQGHLLSVSCSVGISIFPDHGSDIEALIRNADAAMYCAKDHGRNNLQFFTQDMNDRAVERLTLENGLRLALDREELFLEYQPQVDLATGKIIGAEALLRWCHPELGLVPPGKFIPIAENSGLIIPIGEWVLRTVCAQARQWQDDGLAPMPVAVNVSAVQFRQECFLQVIRNVLDETGLPPQYLELELTESLLLSTADVMLSELQQLKDMGLKLSIDDFGTGYSSLSYLRHLPVYKLKIDRSFVQAMTVDRDNAAITATIISMARTLNLKVIAEGVETEQQMLLLRASNCDEAQGYYFSKALAAGDFAEKIRRRTAPLLSNLSDSYQSVEQPQTSICT
jgi:diguanylate cyclase (GGDEF)-like protein/PAS domain S-box-containing protein